MKIKTVYAVLVTISLVLSSQAMAANYVIDKKGQHASVIFRANHLGYSYIVGRFNDFDGSFSHDKDNPSASRVNVVINAKSLDTNHAERDKHLRSDDFIHADKYPTITFDSTGYVAGSDGDTLKGKLSLHGVTKEVSIAVKQIGEGKDPWGGYRSGFKGEVSLNAADYGLPEWVGMLDVELVVEGIRQ